MFPNHPLMDSWGVKNSKQYCNKCLCNELLLKEIQVFFRIDTVFNVETD